MKVISIFTNEQHLIKKAVQKNRDAQRRLYELHAPKMLSVCRQYIRDRQQAEEAMCNGFVKMFAHLKEYKFEGSFEGWVRRIMIRESISYLRKYNKIKFTYEVDERIPSYTQADSNLEVEYIQDMIDALPEGYRIVFVMYAVEGYKHKEIADMLNISESTSKSQLFKARKVLQQQLINLNKYQNGTHEI